MRAWGCKTINREFQVSFLLHKTKVHCCGSVSCVHDENFWQDGNTGICGKICIPWKLHSSCVIKWSSIWVLIFHFIITEVMKSSTSQILPGVLVWFIWNNFFVNTDGSEKGNASAGEYMHHFLDKPWHDMIERDIASCHYGREEEGSNQQPSGGRSQRHFS